MHGAAKPKIREVKAGDALVDQGDWGKELYLVLDGVLQVSVDGEALGVLGPGAVVGERAFLENRPRTSTLRALTAVRVAAAPAEAVDRAALDELSGGHRREEQ
jgi:CRP-like cAMP-binding protein